MLLYCIVFHVIKKVLYEACQRVCCSQCLTFKDVRIDTVILLAQYEISS